MPANAFVVFINSLYKKTFISWYNFIFIL